MRVILLQEIAGVGKKWEIKEVSDGYARNFLIPKKLAKPATKSDLVMAEDEKTNAVKAAEADLAHWQEIASAVGGLELIIPAKVSDSGILYGGVTEQKITEVLCKLGHQVERSWVKLDKPIKELGEFPVTVTFPHGLEAQIKIIIEEEKESQK